MDRELDQRLWHDRQRKRERLGGDRWTRVALAGAMIAPLVVGSLTHSDLRLFSLMATLGLAGWAVLRTPTGRIKVLALIVVSFWTLIFIGATVTDDGAQPIGPTPSNIVR